jgi:hypothetical protein
MKFDKLKKGAYKEQKGAITHNPEWHHPLGDD